MLVHTLLFPGGLIPFRRWKREAGTCADHAPAPCCGSMNFNQLRYIVAVDRHRNFSRAAEECKVAQATLSRGIQRLEQEFDIMIFDRTRQPVVTTLKGIELVAQAKRIIKEQEAFIAIATKKANRPAGDFRLGVVPSLAPYILPLFIRKLSTKYPELNVEVFELGEQGMVQAFESEQLDGAIAIAPFIKEGYYEEPLFQEEFMLYLRLDHPLAAKAEVPWAEIPTDELLLYDEFKSFMRGSGSFKHGTGLHRISNIDYHSGSLETIRKVIDRNGGITLIPRLASLYMGERRLKMLRPIVDPVPSLMVAFITPRGFEKNRLTKVIKQEIMAGVARGE